MAALDLAGPSFRTLAPLSRCKHGIHCSVNLEGKSLLARGKFLSLIGTSKDRKRRNALSMSVAVRCNASEVSVAGSAMEMEKGWVPVVPLAALPRGERRLVRQNNEEILLLWYKNDVVGIENKSPAEGAYSEGLINAKLTPVASSSACERNWSTYGFIHSARRGRLEASRAENLVYVHSTLRLMSRRDKGYTKGSFARWDAVPDDSRDDSKCDGFSDLPLPGPLEDPEDDDEEYDE